MTTEGTTAGVVPEPANVPDSESGFDHSQENAEQPLTGEATERQAPWRPSDEQPANQIYEGTSDSEPNDAEAEGRGI